jgi:hypothetical protein
MHMAPLSAGLTCNGGRSGRGACRLWNLLSEPKELALFDGVGHLPPLELRIPAIREFLDRVVK